DRSDQAPDAPFHCDATLCALPGLSLAALTTSATRVSRTRDLIADGKTDFCLTIPREGTAFASQLGREASLAEGGGVLCRSAEPGSLAARRRSSRSSPFRRIFCCRWSATSMRP
ncbi:MAG: hypothetical protein WAL40_09440, partial [Rhodoplanes sp.]